ncbi:MAG: alpha/beta hydrolase [Candidatus Zixiibacteriota bacterium]|nr:MAG: alpha/beta hydrolase [candidate division Zixibacteria bacterium]
MKAAFSVFYLLVSWSCVSFCQQGDKPDTGMTTRIAVKERIEELLVYPACLDSFSETTESYIVEEVIIPSGEIKLHGQLYLPKKPGPHPAIVYMHGGGNDYDMLMSAPKYYAPRLAHCGYAALIYDKRGTGESGGVFHESTYDDYISDAGHAADFLAKHEQIDLGKIGVYGGSQGGRLAPLVATRYPSVSFAISASGPIGTLADHANFNMEYALKVRGYEDTTIEQVMPLWRKHHAAWESLDPRELNEVAEETIKKRKYIDTFALPNTRQEFFADSNLFFLRPVYNSMSRDYLGELVNLDVPWLALFGELDPVINVPESVENIKKQMSAAGNGDFEIIIFDNAGHSFQNQDTGEYIPTINVVINWLKEKTQD